jgi:hypothetical protein
MVAARLGDDPKTVLSVYSHLLPHSDEIAAERVAGALSALGTPSSPGGSAPNFVPPRTPDSTPHAGFRPA